MSSLSKYLQHKQALLSAEPLPPSPEHHPLLLLLRVGGRADPQIADPVLEHLGCPYKVPANSTAKGDVWKAQVLGDTKRVCCAGGPATAAPGAATIAVVAAVAGLL